MKGFMVVVAAVAAVASAVAFGGCSESVCVGSGCSISSDTVAAKARTAIDRSAEKKGLPSLPPVSCPNDLDLKVGASEHCVAKGNFNGQQRTLGINAKVTSVHGKKYNLDFETTGFE